MTHDYTTPDEPSELSVHEGPTNRSRRKFLGFAAAGVATAGGTAFALRGDGDVPAVSADGNAPAGPTTTTTPLKATADYAARTLVVVELAGGNDGLATVVPRNAGVLYDRRPSVHVPDEELLDFTDEFGWNPNLERLSSHGVAALMGVGTLEQPDGSHFEMERRWWSGQSSGTDLPATGFLGRLCDQLEDGQPVTGVSLGSGATPALLSEKAVTMGLTDPGSGWFLETDDPWFATMRRGLRDMAVGAGPAGPIPSARRGLSDTLAFAESLNRIDTESIRDRFPNSDLGWQFGLAAQLVSLDAGIRIVHIAHGGFDTHSGQRGDHDYLLMELSDAMGAFLEDIGDKRRGDSTLVCTTSEFGRRVHDNDGGTDHGAASLALLAGPVEAGIHGEVPSLTQLDDDNLVATTDFEQYYATLSETWFGVPASELLDSNVNPVDGLITA
ncbi:MAG: DUF1501 domain-containing protein [Acidimicrobiales bacterium]